MTRDATADEPADGSDGDATLSPAEQRRAVRQRYGSIGERDDESCCDESAGQQSSCCDDGAGGADRAGGCGDGADDCGGGADASHSQALGYSDDDVASVADGANLGLGCGNPKAIADLKPGETVLDLGSGGGFDCFLAAREVGADGHVVGVDMTPEMVERARENVGKNDLDNVEFRLGEIEHLPVRDAHVDVVISNCVVNLSPDKQRVFEEAYRVLRPGGRLAITDVVMTADVPPELRADPESVAGCVAGAATIDDLRQMIESAGFESVSIQPKQDSDEFIREWSDEHALEEYLVSAVIEAEKPGKKR